MSRILDAALKYARRGIPVFPTRRSDKAPLNAHGFLDASTDEATIRGWFSDPGANIAVPTGARIGVLVIDEDPRHGGDETLAKIAAGREMPAGPVTTTGGGGRHFWFKDDKRFTVGAGKGELAGVDFRGTGGYVVVAPSIHASGNPYVGEVPSPDDCPTIPEWLADAILAARKTPIMTRLDDDPIPEGARNETLFLVGCKLRGQDWDGESIRGHLLLVNARRCVPPLAPQEVEAVVTQILKYEPGTEVSRAVAEFSKRFKITLGAGVVAPDNGPEPRGKSAALVLTIGELLEEDKTLQFTDSGNASYLAARLGKGLRFVEERGRWFFWDGRRWREDVSGKVVLNLAEGMMRAQLLEAASAPKIDSHEVAKAATATKRNMIDNALALAAGRLLVGDGTFDKDPSVLNVLNGTIDLRTGLLRAHDPNDFITVLAPVEYVPTAKCPRFLSFLDEVLPGVPIEALQRWLGYTFTGDDRERKMQIWRGEKAKNGKSSLKNIVLHIAGDYGIEIPVTTFTRKERDYKGDDLVALKKTRIVFASEPADGMILNAAFLKNIVGLDKIRCRPLKSNSWIEYYPEFHITILTNYEIGIYEPGNGIWDRLDLLVFPNRFDGPIEDKLLDEKLRAEAEGILAWIVEGAVEWYKSGLIEIEKVVSDSKAYRDRQDLFGQFLAWYNDPNTLAIEGMSMVKIEDRWPVGSAILHILYGKWCREEGGHPLGARKFKTEMENRGYIHARAIKGVMWDVGRGISPYKHPPWPETLGEPLPGPPPSHAVAIPETPASQTIPGPPSGHQWGSAACNCGKFVQPHTHVQRPNASVCFFEGCLCTRLPAVL